MIFFKTRSKKSLIDELKVLTPKESEVYNLLLEGYRLKEIAEMLKVKFTTINEHTKSIYKKLDVHSQKELIVKYHSVFKNGEVSE